MIHKFGGKKGKYLAGAVLDDDVTVLTDSTGLLRKGLGSSGIGLGFEVMFLVRHGGGFFVALKNTEERRGNIGDDDE